MNEIKGTITGQLQQLQMLMYLTMINHFGKISPGVGMIILISGLSAKIGGNQITL